MNEEEEKGFKVTTEILEKMTLDDRIKVHSKVIWAVLFKAIMRNEWDESKMGEFGDVLVSLLCRYLYVCTTKESREWHLAGIGKVILEKLAELDLEMEEIGKKINDSANEKHEKEMPSKKPKNKTNISKARNNSHFDKSISN